MVAAAAGACFVGVASAYALSAEQIDATTDSMTFKLNIDSSYQNVQMGKIELRDTGSADWIEVPAQFIEELTPERAKLVNLGMGSTAAQIKFSYTYTSSYSGTTLSSYATVYDPVTVSGKVDDLRLVSELPNTKKLMFGFGNPGTMCGYEIKLTPKSGKAKTIKNNGTYLTSASKISTTYESMKLDTVYNAKVRTYVLMSDKTTKKWSAWSASTVIVPQPHVTGKRYSTYADAKWTKIKGVKNYTIYYSSKKDKGYKKLTTTTKSKYRITKLGGKKLTSKKHFYFYVKANAKSGGKAYSSPFLIYSYA